MPTIINISSEHVVMALDLCAELVRTGRMFHCERKPSSWENEV